MEYLLEGIATLTQMRRVTNTNLLFGISIFERPNEAIASTKCFIKAPCKYKTFVLMEIYLE